MFKCINQKKNSRYLFLSRSYKLVLLLVSLFSSNVFAQYQRPTINMTPGVTPLSHEIYDLHMTMFSICVVIGIVVFGVLFYALIFHRKSRGITAASFHGNTTVEIIWAIVPLLILIVMAVPATMVIRDFNDIPDAAVTIKITGYQWKWQYQYLDQGISYFSNLSTPMDQMLNKAPKNKWYLLQVDNPIVVPTHEKIRFLITANDVIHSWWVPALGIKRDAIPGFIHEAWAEIDEPGTYRGQCAELCGANHGFMPIVVVAKTPADFHTWVLAQQKIQAQSASTQKLSFDQLMKLGQVAYGKYCVACHQVTGLGLPPVYPALKASSIAVGQPLVRHLDTVLNGVPGPRCRHLAHN